MQPRYTIEAFQRESGWGEAYRVLFDGKPIVHTAFATEYEAQTYVNRLNISARKDSMDKIRLKSAPKQYKTAPGARGRSLLQRRVNTLLAAAFRMRKSGKTPEDIRWAERLSDTLLSFNAEMQAEKLQP